MGSLLMPAVQLNILSLVVMSAGPSSQLRAVDQVVCPCGTCWALELALQFSTSWAAGPEGPGQPSEAGQVVSVHRLRTCEVWVASKTGKRRSAAAADAPPVPLPPGQPARRKAEGVGPLLSMPDFSFCEGQTQPAS